MKINRLETHDRLQQFGKQSDSISIACQKIVDQRPFGEQPFYIFAHKREIGMDEKFSLMLTGKFNDLSEIPSARIIWQPRLTKPKAQTNSMLFKAYPGTDNIKIVWIIPERELWDQYRKGNLTECKIVVECIHDFEHNREKLEAKDEDDLTDDQIDGVYEQLSKQANSKKIKI